jgi:hypothetical protein
VYINWRTHKKSSESGWVWKSRKAGEILKDAICFEQGGHLNFFKTKDHGIDEGKNNFRGAVMIIPLFVGESSANESSHLQLLQELMEEIDASEMGQITRRERNLDISGPRTWHFMDLTLS